jgi:hypothetical protein
MYAVDHKTLQSREIGATAQRQPSRDVALPWCRHANSPAPQQVVRGVIGGALLLQCGGDVSKCQVPGGPTAMP